MPSEKPAHLVTLWRAVIRFDAGKVRLWRGIRSALGAAITLLACAALGQTAYGIVAAMGSLNAALGDGTDAYAHRARRMLTACLFCSLAVFAGSIAGGTYANTPILAVGAFAAGMSVALGSSEADIGLMTLVVLIIFSVKPLSPGQAFTSGLFALGGGLIQTALALAFWPLWRSTPERRALAALYVNLSAAAATASTATKAPPASRASTEAQQALAALDAGSSVESASYIALLSQAERIRLTLLALALLTIVHQPDAPSLIGLEEPDRGLHPRLLRELRDALYRLSFPADFGIERAPVQVVVTTHSPLFLDLFKDHPEQVIIAEKSADGTASFKNLSDDGQLREIIGDAPLGEVWYSDVLGGVPVAA